MNGTKGQKGPDQKARIDVPKIFEKSALKISRVMTDDDERETDPTPHTPNNGHTDNQRQKDGSQTDVPAWWQWLPLFGPVDLFLQTDLLTFERGKEQKEEESKTRKVSVV